MAKGVQKPAVPPPPQRAVLSRLSFLHQAAALLSLPSLPHPPQDDASSPVPPVGLGRYYTSQLLSVSKKSVQRLSPAVKHTICKRCSSVLTPGVSCTTRVENKSKHGKKPWADVLVIQCNFCQACKRYPMCERSGEARTSTHTNKKKTPSKGVKRRKPIADTGDGIDSGTEKELPQEDAAMTGT
ncbi:hypothetical protein H072_10209 [Dactylellina haptotyla CBS 200.50]|uniref:Rpr2-domain-containing protein n=1 Tax=Dactylellina haptotyla (strain CBS 200.50) TaxID=1284197 RepID=S8BM28_DACHA|nr:hypothetical protein H072_10209 [Dactylellina haptotyla CBS 200.50]